jgi:hypothetical protein
MNRLVRLAILMLTISSIASGMASATTYYIAANGSDSNSGTSNTSPWQHAPGMPSCSGSCSSVSPRAGDQFIFRGGDTWHFGAGSPLIGGGWNWQWSGSNGSPIYIGVDKTWYSGSSWARPVMTGDNPTSTSLVSGCTHDYSNAAQLVNLSASWITFDNFEMTGICWSSQVSDNGMLAQPGGSATNSIVSNFYCHGWTMTSGASDNFPCILTLGGGAANDYNQYVGDIFDGSDAPHFAANSSSCQWGGNSSSGCASGQGIYGRAWDVHQCIFRYLSNFMVTVNTHTVHDNVFEYLYPTFASGSIQQHPNVLNNIAGETGDPLYFYNNIMRNTYSTENIYFAVRTSIYFFNNVMYNNMNSTVGSIPGGCIRFNSVSNSSGNQSAYIYNNTMGDSTCQLKFEVANSPLTPWNGTGYFENNHFIGSSSLGNVYICATGGTCNIADNGSEVFQTTSVANGQGYTASNDYAPTAATNATVGAGANLNNSCGTFSSDSELCSGTSDAVSEPTGSGGKIASYPAIAMVPRPSSGAWGAGAYQFGGGQAAPNPPTGLQASIQ